MRECQMPEQKRCRRRKRTVKRCKHFKTTEFRKEQIALAACTGLAVVKPVQARTALGPFRYKVAPTGLSGRGPLPLFRGPRRVCPRLCAADKFAIAFHLSPSRRYTKRSCPGESLPPRLNT